MASQLGVLAMGLRAIVWGQTMMAGNRTALKAGLASAALGFALLAGPVRAQNHFASEPPGEVPTDARGIIVTGSILREPGATTASPVTSFSADDLARRGIITVADALQQLAANNAGTEPASWSSHAFAFGTSAPSLRGFNDGYTLTLINGLRSAYYPMADDGSRNFVDINTIPSSIVERLDVLQDGASATYGADAVAGVINVIVKKEITGLHLNASNGISQLGDAGERRFDGTLGFGKLARDGYNIYVNGEFQQDDAVMLNQRGYPYNTSDLSHICNAAGACMNNGVINGIQANGGFSVLQTSSVPFVRAYNAAGTIPSGAFQMLNPAAGCQGLTPYALTAANLAKLPASIKASLPSVVCQQDLNAQYGQYDPAIKRWGSTARATVNLGTRAQAYAMFNYYEVETASTSASLAFAGQTAPGGPQVTVSPVFLPIYICPTGIGTPTSQKTGCTAANGTLNPNNPFAANGQMARLLGRYDLPRQSYSDAKTLRLSGGVNGSFGKDWNYSVEAMGALILLDAAQLNAINAQHLLDMIATGGYNFVDQSRNSQAARDYLAPPARTHSTSKMTELQATLNKNVMALPGGALNVAVGASFRYEAINNPSANAPNSTNPYDRYYTINAFGVDASRHVWSGFYEISLPLASGLRVKADGRYDSYSSGQGHFSPKFEVAFRPFDQLQLRGTWSQGFRIASLNQLYALPTTSFTTSMINCAAYAAFCAAHASDPAYISGSYALAGTALANPNLAPERSHSFTAGFGFSPNSHFSLTVDYWNTEITHIIISPVANLAIRDAYYLHNGVVNIPGYTISPGLVDPLNPAALPLLGNVTAAYANADEQEGSGLDFKLEGRFALGHGGLRLISQFNAALLLKLALTDSGLTQVYDGTLGPCNITACSGAPHWRGSWSNTLDFGGKATMTLTANYTSGYSLAAADLGGVPGNCTASIGASVVTFSDGTPVKCSTNATFDLDFNGQIRVRDRLTLSLTIINLLNSPPPYDPSAAYGYYQFNPAWAGRNFIGRYFRIGAKLDF